MPEITKAKPCDCPGKLPPKDFKGTAKAVGDENDWEAAAESSARSAAADKEPDAKKEAESKAKEWLNNVECTDGCEGKGCEKKLTIKITTTEYSEPKLVRKRIVKYSKSIERIFYTYECEVTVTIAATVNCICKK